MIISVDYYSTLSLVQFEGEGALMQEFVEGAVPTKFFRKYYDLHDEMNEYQSIYFDDEAGLYHLRDFDDNVKVFETPNDHKIFKRLVKLIDTFKEDQFIRQHRMYGHEISHMWEGGWMDVLSKLREHIPGIMHLADIPEAAFQVGHPAKQTLSEHGIDFELSRSITWSRPT